MDLTIAASGDLLIHSPVFFQALANGGGERYDFRPMLGQVRQIVRSADLGICHLETPLTAAEPEGEPTFKAPAELAGAIRWVGWDACSNASNHSYDDLEPGVRFTIRTLDRNGDRALGHQPQPARPARGDDGGQGREGGAARLHHAHHRMPTPPNGWTLNMAEPDRILADAREARRRGAAVVIVSVHWGDEYVHEPSQRAALAGAHAHRLPARGRGDRPARARGAADPARERQAGGVRRGQPALQPDGRLLPGGVAGRDGGAAERACGPRRRERARACATCPPGSSTRASRWCRASGESRKRTIGYAGRQPPWLARLRLGSAPCRSAPPSSRSSPSRSWSRTSSSTGPAPARCWCAWRPAACATPTSTRPAAPTRRATPPPCSATRAPAWSRRWATA